MSMDFSQPSRSTSASSAVFVRNVVLQGQRSSSILEGQLGNVLTLPPSVPFIQTPCSLSKQRTAAFTRLKTYMVLFLESV